MKNIAIENILKWVAKCLKKDGSLVGISDDDLYIIIKKLAEDWLPTQEEVDVLINGNDVYKNLVANTGKPINHGLCISSELAELLDSIPWKHWKDINAKADLDNYETELVDLLHFLPAAINVFMLKLLAVNNRDYSMRVADLSDQHTMLVLPVGDSDDDIYKLTSWFMVGLGSDAACITATYNKLLDDSSLVSDDELYYSLAVSFIATAKVFKLHSLVFKVSMKESIEKLWSVYLVKNVLNIFRANNGYKEGTYKKMWDGVEDNAVVKTIAMNLISLHHVVDKDLLYAKTEEFYKGLNK